MNQTQKPETRYERCKRAALSIPPDLLAKLPANVRAIWAQIPTICDELAALDYVDAATPGDALTNALESHGLSSQDAYGVESVLDAPRWDIKA